MFTSRRSLLATAAAAVLATSLPMAAHAAEGDYPNRPITIVVPHAPGGPVDGVARMFAERLKEGAGPNRRGG